MYSAAVQELIDELGRLPGIGPKSAQRIAFYLLKAPAEDAARLAGAIGTVKARVTWCRRCFNIAETPEQSELAAVGNGRGVECDICRDERRDPSLVCVVEEPKDVVSIERTRGFHGRYHVLQGVLSPIDGVGPDQLRIRELLDRIGGEGVAEVILCFPATMVGDATALYLAAQLKDMPVRVTRIASGLPVGGDLEYADEVTLGLALEGRREIGV